MPEKRYAEAILEQQWAPINAKLLGTVLGKEAPKKRGLTFDTSQPAFQCTQFTRI